MLDFNAFDPMGGFTGIDPLTGQAEMPQAPPPVPLDPSLTPPTRLPPVQALDAVAPQQPMTPGPQVTITPPPSPPPIKPPVSPTSGAPASQPDQQLGAAIGGTPGAPMDIRSEAQKAGEANPQQVGKGPMDRLAGALKGVQPPKAPEPLKIGAPNLPRGGAMPKSSQVAALLASLSPQSSGGLQLPQTLGAAIKR